MVARATKTAKAGAKAVIVSCLPPVLVLMIVMCVTAPLEEEVQDRFGDDSGDDGLGSDRGFLGR
eukprot:5738333-Pyramimonas_sp.AAC.1